MSKSKYITIMLIPDGAGERRGWRVSRWLLKTIAAVLATIILGIIIFFSLYGQILARATMAEQLREENERLKKYYYKVQLLEDNLNQAREIVTRLTTLAGIDFEFPTLPDDSTIFAAVDEFPSVIPRSLEVDLSTPTGLPVQGFISQDFEIVDQDHYHPGIDIACAVGTPVLTTASGVVIYADYDTTYGNMIIIRHNDSTTTVYGHNDTLLVIIDKEVIAGSRIAHSGNTGKSTAPHLHYEVRINDKPINPLESQ